MPSDLDAVVIGSGGGALSTSVLLSKAGKKVLILEQHDQAGGAFHTFMEKGYEFDTGVHYVGEMDTSSIFRTMYDQLTDWQVEWAPMEDAYDVISIGLGEENRLNTFG